MDPTPTQNKLRDIDKVFSIATDVSFILEKKVSVIVTPDNCLWIRDGHHRATALWLVFGNVPANYIQFEWCSYESMMTKNIQSGWTTPFDPRIHCRVEDTSAFRTTISSILSKHPVEYAKNYIDTFYFLYRENRKSLTIRQMFENSFKNNKVVKNDR